MFQAKLRNGPSAGAHCLIRKLPFVLGRPPHADWPLTDPGVWERHLTLELADGADLRARARPEATALKNGQPFQETTLRNGDVLELGSAKIEIELSPLTQRSLRPREWATWIGLALLALGQIALIYWLYRLSGW